MAVPRRALRAQLVGSGAILLEVLKAQDMLAADFGVSADVWSATSYTQLARDANEVARWNRRHPGEAPRTSHIQRCLGSADGVIVAASDYVKALPDTLGRWLDRPVVSLGTDGFGRSESRASLRDFFEVDARHIVAATLSALAASGQIAADVPRKALRDFGIDPDRPNPAVS